MSGVFITFEGTEGSGKSTQIKILADRLSLLGHPVRALREPGGTPVGEEIRRLLKRTQENWSITPETELLLVNASRAQLVTEIIRPALENGEIVLCDRFHDSTVAYQGHGRRLDLDLVKKIVDAAVGRTRPNLTVWFHVPVVVSERRRQLRNEAEAPAKDRFEESDREFFERVEQGYLAIAAAEPERIKVIDGTLSQKAVARAVWGFVEPLLSRIVTQEGGR